MGPNDFVNPDQRGVELPPGCKDLMDVLRLGGSERQEEGVFAAIYEPVISYGALSEIEEQVKAFLELGTGERLLSVGIPQRRIQVILLKRKGGLTLNFSITAKQRSVVRRMFQEPKIGKPYDGRAYVSVALGPAKDVVAGTIGELLVHVFGVLEGERLIFHSYEEVERTEEG